MIRVKNFNIRDVVDTNPRIDIQLLERYRVLSDPLIPITDTTTRGASFSLKRPLDDRMSDLIGPRLVSRQKRQPVNGDS